jgi:TIR domain/Pentapeptide repeats (8 copies)
MANAEHLSLLLQGSVVWNNWRKSNPDIRASLGRADLSKARLSGANLSRADLSGANLSGAMFFETVFGDVDLTKAIGLDKCVHIGPSIIDFRTLSRSANLPISFLRGCGLSDRLIEYIPSLRNEAIQFYSCFISYSSKDQKFAEKLHADLQNAGVRCWFAPHDLPIGAKTWDAIDEAIRLRDKLLVILSKASISSDWVEDEVNKAYAEERDRKAEVLFPVRIDDVVMTTPEPWARKLRDQRNIGDFRQWGRVARYSKSLERLLRDLKAATGT